jgi:hypothetical protein
MSGSDLFSFDELNEMIDETYRLWIEILEERVDERRRAQRFGRDRRKAEAKWLRLSALHPLALCAGAKRGRASSAPLRRGDDDARLEIFN